jgi:hypothetical protein
MDPRTEGADMTNANELEGEELDQAVAEALGWHDSDGSWCGVMDISGRVTREDDPAQAIVGGFRPSRNWWQGGVIIEREGIWLTHANGTWFADIPGESGDPDNPPPVDGFGRPGHVKGTGSGPTPLIAAMRAFAHADQMRKAPHPS